MHSYAYLLRGKPYWFEWELLPGCVPAKVHGSASMHLPAKLYAAWRSATQSFGNKVMTSLLNIQRWYHNVSQHHTAVKMVWALAWTPWRKHSSQVSVQPKPYTPVVQPNLAENGKSSVDRERLIMRKPPTLPRQGVPQGRSNHQESPLMGYCQLHFWWRKNLQQNLPKRSCSMNKLTEAQWIGLLLPAVGFVQDRVNFVSQWPEESCNNLPRGLWSYCHTTELLTLLNNLQTRNSDIYIWLSKELRRCYLMLSIPLHSPVN